VESLAMTGIAFITTSLNVGGAEKQWLNLINKMNKTSFKIVLICLYDLGEVGNQIRDTGIITYSNIFKNRYSILSVFKLVNILKKENISIIFMMHLPLLIIYGSIAAKIAGIKNVISAVHSTGYIDRKYRSFITDKIFLVNINTVVALSEQHKNYLMTVVKYPEDKLQVISNGVDISVFSQCIDTVPIKARLGIKCNEKVVGIIGRLHSIKRHDVFIDAAYLAQKYYKDIVYLIIGDGAEITNINKKILRLGMTERIKVLGQRNDMAELIKILDISVLSSDSEALPMSIIESMAASVPIVATNVGSVRDLVIDGVNGYIISPNSSKELASAMLKIIDDKKLAKNMGEMGAKIARERFSDWIMVDKYEELFLNPRVNY
jgi:glycosyltransferase involved in cell wall biosynthesis